MLPRWNHSLNGGCCPDVGKLLPLLGGEGRSEGEHSIRLNRYGSENISASFCVPFQHEQRHTLAG